MKNSFVNKGGGNSFISKYMTPAAGGGTPVLWDGTYPQGWKTNNAYIFVDTTDTLVRSIFIDVSSVATGATIRINTDNVPGKNQYCQTSETIEDLLAWADPSFTDTTTIAYGDLPAFQDYFDIVKVAGTNTIVFYTNNDGAPSEYINSVEVL